MRLKNSQNIANIKGVNTKGNDLFRDLKPGVIQKNTKISVKIISKTSKVSGANVLVEDIN